MELLVCIVVVGILGWMLVLFTSHALLEGQMTGTLNNARQLHLATETMALETYRAGGEGMDWTMLVSHGKTSPVSLAAYFETLVKNNYLTKHVLRKLLSAPGKQPMEDDLSARSIAFKVFQTNEESPWNQPLFVTANWQSTGLTDDAPYRKMGFVVFAKGGSGGIYNRSSDVTDTHLFPPAIQGSHPYRYITLE
jgi:hypothetical protein